MDGKFIHKFKGVKSETQDIIRSIRKKDEKFRGRIRKVKRKIKKE